MPPNMMTNEEEMQLTIGHGHVLYTGGADGTDILAEEMAREYGMQIEVIVPPNHPRAKFTSPASVEVLIQADPAIGAAAHKLCKRVPTHFYTLSLSCSAITTLPEKPIPPLPFENCVQTKKEWKEELGGLCN